MYDLNTSTDVPENFVCMAIWGSVKGYSALSCQDLSFLVGRRSAVPLSVYPFIISFTFLFLHFFAGTPHLDPGCAIFVRDFFRWSVFGIMTKLMGSPKTHGVTGHVGIREF